jgi:quercetin dioxygenase-like cupin family protein
MKRQIQRILSVLIICLLSLADLFAQSGQDRTPTPHGISLDPAAQKSVDLFQGPPETVTMRSGYVVLAPGQSVGKHSTRGYEESVTILAGTGEMRITGGETLKLRRFSVGYCPPQTEHDVFNTGTDTLRYIWLVARAPGMTTDRKK